MTRYATSFTNDIGTFTFPTKGRREQRHLVSWREASMQGFRLDGVIDSWGESRAPLRMSRYDINFWLTDFATEAAFETARDAMAAVLAGGSGKLRFNDLGATQELYAFARPAEVEATYLAGVGGKSAMFRSPFWLINPILYRNLAATIETFITSASEVTVGSTVFGESDSWDSPYVFASRTISASPTTIAVVANPGQLRTHRLIIRIEAVGANDCVNPKVFNETTGQFWEYTGTIARPNGVLQANCAIGASRVRLSTDLGATWANAWPDCSLGPTQFGIMELERGNNTITVTSTGTNNFRVLLLWKPADLI